MDYGQSLESAIIKFGGAGKDGFMTQWTYFDSGYTAMLDLDVIDGHYEGIFTGHGNKAPVEVAFISTKDLGASHKLDAQITVFLPGTRQALGPEEIRRYFPEGHQSTVPVELLFGAEHLDVWVDNEVLGRRHFRLANPQSGQISQISIEPGVSSWDQFTRYCSKLPEMQFVFRGQDSPKRLRTSFHRTERSDLYRYSRRDLSAAYRALSGKTRHVFTSSDADQHAAFLNLLQHHGFPTPLLDWSDSPFIAAYFAFAKRRADHEDLEAPVRVLSFDRSAWERHWAPIPHLTHVGPHVTMLYPLSIENPRASPQQAVSMVTNLDDIEAYVRACEELSGASYLKAFDLRYEERDEVLKDLAMMGITHGTIFPGIEGTCVDLRHRFFGRP